MKAEIIDTPERLGALEQAWWRLFHTLPGITPFSSPAWLLAWWHVFCPGTLCSVAVWHGTDLVGLAPLYIEEGPLGRRLLPIGIGVSDYADVLLHPGYPDTAAFLFAALARQGSRWEVWSAEELPPGSATLDLEPSRGWKSSLRPGSACPVLVLPASGRAVDAVPHRQRGKWRLAANRAARRAGHVRRASAATVTSDLAHLARLHAARWEQRGQAGVMASDPVRQFHARAVPSLFAAGLLRMVIVELDDAVAGVYYGLSHGSRAYFYLVGFDPRFAFESPGTIVVGAAIETALSEGCTEFHFLRGQERYKYGWGAVDRWNACREFRLDR